MTSVLTIEGKEYVPATIAGKHFGYTKDYFLLLIKQGHVDGQKIGNKWYVNIPSAEKFFSTARAKREVRKKEMSLERKAELRKYSQVKKKSKKNPSRNFSVAVGTLAVMIIMFSIGTISSVTISSQQATAHDGVGFFENIARMFYAFIEPSHSEIVEVSQVTPVAVPMEETAVSTHVGTTTYTSIVVAPDELFTATTIESIQDSFSDPVNVSVDPENPNTGIITPVFKEGKQGENYRFLMVPVTKPATTT